MLTMFQVSALEGPGSAAGRAGSGGKGLAEGGLPAYCSLLYIERLYDSMVGCYAKVNLLMFCCNHYIAHLRTRPPMCDVLLCISSKAENGHYLVLCHLCQRYL